MENTSIPPIDSTIEISKIEVQENQLNGVQLFYINGGATTLLKMELIFDAGSRYQSYPLVASMGVDLLKDGTQSCFGNAFKETIAGLGVYYGFEVTKDYTSLTFFVLEKHLKALLGLIGKLLTEPSIRREEFDRLLKKRKNDFLIDSKRTSFLARQKFAAELFHSTPYGVVADEASFDNLKFEDCANFIEQYIVRSPFQLWVSGGVSDVSKLELEQFIKLIDSTQGKPSVDGKEFQFEANAQHFKIEKDTEQSSLILGVLVPNILHEDGHKVRIVNTLLGGYFGSRLMQNIREDKGWTYGIHSMIVDHKDCSSLVIAADVLKDKKEACLEEIRKELQKLIQEKATDEELLLLRNYLKGKLIRSFDGAMEQGERYFNVRSFGLDWSYYDQYIQELEQLSLEDVQQIAEKYFQFDQMTIVSCGPKE